MMRDFAFKLFYLFTFHSCFILVMLYFESINYRWSFVFRCIVYCLWIIIDELYSLSFYKNTNDIQI